jgi:hypothetical protein
MMNIIVSIEAINVEASMPNWSLCRIVQAATSLGKDAWQQWQQNRRNKTTRLVFLHNGTSRIDQSRRSRLSYGHHGATFPAFKHKTISQHSME